MTEKSKTQVQAKFTSLDDENIKSGENFTGRGRLT